MLTSSTNQYLILKSKLFLNYLAMIIFKRKHYKILQLEICKKTSSYLKLRNKIIHLTMLYFFKRFLKIYTAPLLTSNEVMMNLLMRKAGVQKDWRCCLHHTAAKCQSLSSHLNRFQKPVQYTFNSVHTSKEIVIKLNFYKKSDSNLGPLRVIRGYLYLENFIGVTPKFTHLTTISCSSTMSQSWF